MTYRPKEKFFGPPLWVRIPSILHLFVALGVVLLVASVSSGPKNTELYYYMFRQAHYVSAHFLAGTFVVSSLASLIRSGMRGVRVRADFIEYRDVVGWVWPKLRRIRWAQIDEIHFETSGSVRLELWDGTLDFLPQVSDEKALAHALERLALARSIPVRGGKGVFDLELDGGAGDEHLEEEEAE